MRLEVTNQSNLKRFILKSLILLTICIFPFVSFNYLIDPCGLFRTDFSKPLINEPNTHFVKIRYLLQNHNKYDSFLFGSSRVGFIEPRRIKNGKYYNLSYPEGVPKEHLDDIKLLLKHSYKIKNIVIELDDISYLVDPIRHLSEAGKKPYPKNEILWPFYLEYLFCLPDLNKIYTVQELKEHGWHVAIYTTGMTDFSNKDNQIDQNPEKHLKDSKSWSSPSPPYYLDRIDQTMEEIQQIKQIAIKNHINLILFITPLNSMIYKNLDFGLYFKFLRRLSTVWGYYDFSGLNEITLNNFYYYEPSHFRTIVGNKIIDRIFNKKMILVTPHLEFG